MEKSAQLTWWASRITEHLPSLSCRAGIETALLAVYVLVRPLAGECAWTVQGNGEYHCGTSSTTVWECALSRFR